MKGTRTEENLLKAFVNESQTRNRYLFYAKIATKEGYEQIGDIFTQTAEHELSHGKNFFKLLESDSDIQVTASYQGGKLSTTVENLRSAIRGEHDDWTESYRRYADEALEDGFPKVAALFRNIAKVEEFHEERFRKVLERLESGIWFERETPIRWMCRKCGYIHTGTSAPLICPACMHPRSYFEELSENY